MNWVLKWIPIPIILAYVIPLLRKELADPNGKASMRRLCLELYHGIKMAYADDPEFA